MTNPLIEMKEALEFGLGSTAENIRERSSKALSVLESSGWNLEAIPQLIEAVTRTVEEGILVSSARYWQLKLALVKLKGGNSDYRAKMTEKK